MIVLFLAVFLSVAILMLSSFSYTISGINRTILTTPYSLFEIAIPLTTQEEEIVLFYDKEKLKLEYESYLNRELTKYTKNYSVEYYFYNTSNGGACDLYNCQGVEITVNAEVMFNMHYKRVMEYEIREGRK